MTAYATPPRPPFDLELVELLSQLPPFLSTLRADEIDKLRIANGVADEAAADAALARDGRVDVAHLDATGPDGVLQVPLILLRPAHGDGPWPTVFWVHGGGLVAGDYHSVHSYMVDAVHEVGIAVVAMKYRLAPEHPYPAAVTDIYAAVTWAAAHSAELGIDPDRLIMAGASAGGGLAAATALMARDRGTPVFSHQLLVYPMLDDRMNTVSSQSLDGDGVWDRTSNHTGWNAYLGAAAGGPDVEPYAAAARASDLRGLPPTFIDAGSTETFRDEAIEYATRLAQAGVPVDLHIWAGGFHGSDQLVPDALVSRAAVSARRGYLDRALRTP